MKDAAGPARASGRLSWLKPTPLRALVFAVAVIPLFFSATTDVFFACQTLEITPFGSQYAWAVGPLGIGLYVLVCLAIPPRRRLSPSVALGLTAAISVAAWWALSWLVDNVKMLVIKPSVMGTQYSFIGASEVQGLMSLEATLSLSFIASSAVLLMLRTRRNGRTWLFILGAGAVMLGSLALCWHFLYVIMGCQSCTSPFGILDAYCDNGSVVLVVYWGERSQPGPREVLTGQDCVLRDAGGWTEWYCGPCLSISRSPDNANAPWPSVERPADPKGWWTIRDEDCPPGVLCTYHLPTRGLSSRLSLKC